MGSVMSVVVAVLLLCGCFAGCSANTAVPADGGGRTAPVSTDAGAQAEAEHADTGADSQNSMNTMLKKYLPELALEYGMGRDGIVQPGFEFTDGSFAAIKDGAYATIGKTALGLTREEGEAKLFLADSCGLFGFSYDVTGDGLEKLTADFGEPVAVNADGARYFDWLVNGVFLSLSAMEDSAHFVVMAGEQAKAEFPDEWSRLEKEPSPGGAQGQGVAWGHGEDYNLSLGGDFVRQGDWIYYFKKGVPGLYKMPVDGSADQVQLLGKPIINYKIYVVGDWIYFACEGYLYRLSTDGKVQEDIMSTDTWANEADYYIAGNELFYSTTKRISASEYTSAVSKFNMDSGTLDVIYEGAGVQRGYRDTLFIDFSDDHIAQIDFSGSMIQKEVPGVGLEYDPAKGTFLWDGKLVYADGTLSEPTLFGDMQSLSIDRLSDTVYFAPKTYQSNLYLIGRGFDDLITQNEPGFYSCDLSLNNIIKINNDTPTHIWQWGDGYVYYSVKSSANYPCYRCRTDGSDWEETGWMYLA